VNSFIQKCQSVVEPASTIVNAAARNTIARPAGRVGARSFEMMPGA